MVCRSCKSEVHSPYQLAEQCKYIHCPCVMRYVICENAGHWSHTCRQRLARRLANSSFSKLRCQLKLTVSIGLDISLRKLGTRRLKRKWHTNCLIVPVWRRPGELIYSMEELVMSTSNLTRDNRNRITSNYADYESLGPREQLIGQLIVILLFLIAILLRSL